MTRQARLRRLPDRAARARAATPPPATSNPLPNSPDQPAVYTPEEAFKLLRVGWNAGYRGLYRNEIPHIRIGHKYFIPRIALERLLAGDLPADKQEARQASGGQVSATKPLSRHRDTRIVPRPAPLRNRGGVR